jgi:acyl carrier protein
VEKKLLSIFNEIFDVDLISFEEDIKMEETDEWNSLRHMELMSEIEEKLQIELTFEEITKMISLKAIRDVLESKEVTN